VTGRLILPAGADQHERELWLAERRKGVTASEIAVLLGISPFDSPFNLFWKKTGQITEDYDNNRLSLGRFLEPWVAERFAETHPDLHLVAPAGLWASIERPWQLATPDGLLYDAREVEYGRDEANAPIAVWEGKTSGTYEDWGDDGSADIPPYYSAQVQWQMDVMGVGVAYVTCLFLATQKTRTYILEPDADDITLMRERAVEFLAQVDAGEAPPLDGHSATTTALKALYPEVDEDEQATVPTDVAEQYRQASAQAKAAKEQATDAENALRAAMGDARYALDPDGRKVASRSVYDRKPYTVGPARIDRLNPSRSSK
jgi:putative phage-type endonuclease